MLKQLPPPPRGREGWPWTKESLPLAPQMSNVPDWPRISIVTPSFNQGNYIEQAIRSVLIQNYQNLDYYILDGGSTDNTVSIIKKYSPWLSGWKSEYDGGQYHAINRGFARSNGTIMLWLNSDDMLLPESLRTIAAIFLKYSQIQWLSGIPLYWNESGTYFQILPQIPYNRTIMQLACYEGRAIHWVMQECTVWTRQLWDQAGGYIATNLQYAGDFELWHRFSFYSKLYTVAALIGGNRRHAEQKTAFPAYYCEDIDRLVNKRLTTKVANKLMRISPIKKTIRAALMVRRMRNHVYFDALADDWKLL